MKSNVDVQKVGISLEIINYFFFFSLTSAAAAALLHFH